MAAKSNIIRKSVAFMQQISYCSRCNLSRRFVPTIKSSRGYLNTVSSSVSPGKGPGKSKVPAILASCAVGVASAGLAGGVWLYRKADFLPMVAHVQAAEVDNSSRHRWNFIADVVDKVGPAVVCIEIHGKYVV